MMTLLFTILRILKVLLLVVLCLFLFILLLILFCPLRYEGAVRGQGKDFTASAKVSWLFSLIGARVIFKDFTPSISLLLFGIPLEQLKKGKGKGKKDSPPDKKKSENKAEKRETASKGKEDSGTAKAKDALPKKEQKKEDTKEKAASVDKTAAEAKTESNFVKKDVNKKAAESENRQQDPDGGSIAGRITGIIRSAAAKISHLAKKIISLPAKGANSLESGKKKMKRAEKKLVRIQKLLAREEIKNALFLALNKFSRLLKHIVPRKFSGEVSYGFADPGDTGMLLAFLSTLYPVHRGNLKIYPDFQEKLFIYDVTLKGRIYGFVIISIALRLLFDKNIQFIIRIIRKKEA